MTKSQLCRSEQCQLFCCQLVRYNIKLVVKKDPEANSRTGIQSNVGIRMMASPAQRTPANANALPFAIVIHRDRSIVNRTIATLHSCLPFCHFPRFTILSISPAALYPLRRLCKSCPRPVHPYLYSGLSSASRRRQTITTSGSTPPDELRLDFQSIAIWQGKLLIYQGVARGDCL